MRERNLGSIGAILFVSGGILAKLLLTTSRLLTEVSGTAAWITVLIKGIVALLLFLTLSALYRPFYGESYAQITKRAFGRVGQAIVGVITALFLAALAASYCRVLVEAMRSISLEETRSEFLALFLLGAASVCVWSGIQSAIKANILLAPASLAMLIIILLALFNDFSLDHALPILGNGIPAILKQTFLSDYCFTEMGLLFLLAPMFSDYKQFRRVGIISWSVATVVSVAFTLCYCLVIPYPASASYFFPLYELARMVNMHISLERLEPLIILLWVSMVLVYVSTAILFSTKLLADAGKLKYPRALNALIVMLVAVAAVYPSTDLIINQCFRALLRAGVIIYPLIPLLLLVVARMLDRRRRLGSHAIR